MIRLWFGVVTVFCGVCATVYAHDDEIYTPSIDVRTISHISPHHDTIITISLPLTDSNIINTHILSQLQHDRHKHKEHIAANTLYTFFDWSHIVLYHDTKHLLLTTITKSAHNEHYRTHYRTNLYDTTTHKPIPLHTLWVDDRQTHLASLHLTHLQKPLPDTYNISLAHQGMLLSTNDEHTPTTLPRTSVRPLLAQAFSWLSLDDVARPDCTIDPCVALTFDDGPSEHTPKLLNILSHYNVPSTFYVMGKHVHNNPLIAKRTAQEWHELGNHTRNHHDLRKISRSDISQEISDTDHIIKQHTWVSVPTFRPPYGSYTRDHIRQIDKAFIMWSVDTRDREHKNPQTILEKVSTARRGDIILFHDVHKTTVDAIPGVIQILRDQWYHLVTVSELLGNNPQPHHKHHSQYH